MKKPLKKLVLTKETLRALDSSDLTQAAGGSHVPRLPTFGESERYVCWGSLTCPSFTC
jgi:hypothetical protein